MNPSVYSLSQTAPSKWRYSKYFFLSLRELNSLRGIDSKLSQLSGIKYTKLKVEQRLPDSNCLATLGGTSDRLQV
jgi:hypothetical protein